MKKTIIGIMVAVFLAGMVAQIGCKEQNRMKLLDQNRELVWFYDFEDKAGLSIGTGDPKDIHIEYRAIKVDAARELVNVTTYVPITDRDGQKSRHPVQTYQMYGKGNEVLWIIWFNRVSNTWIEISVPEAKVNLTFDYINIEEPLSDETIKTVVKNGIEYYSKVRKYYKVDTYERLKEVVERRKFKKQS